MSWSRKHRVFMDWLYDIVGAMLHAVGVWCFIEPCKIAPGGASGIALLINHLFGLPVGTLTLLINVPLLIAYRFACPQLTTRLPGATTSGLQIHAAVGPRPE